MLREDKTASVWREDRPLRRARYTFAYGKGAGRVNVKLEAAWVDEAKERKNVAPVLAHQARDGTQWWWHRDSFYIDKDGLDADAVTAILHQRHARKAKMVERAKADYRGDQQRQIVRQPILEAVRHEVWRRDGGRCVSCGSRERLEFDHIVPVSAGGSNTARNIELRCEPCNGEKAATI